MISNPQEIEQEAIAIANWIVYNNRPFIIPTSDGKRVVLCLMTEDEYLKAVGNGPRTPVEAKDEALPIPVTDSDDA